jgi:hypothetical protein
MTSIQELRYFVGEENADREAICFNEDLVGFVRHEGRIRVARKLLKAWDSGANKLTIVTAKRLLFQARQRERQSYVAKDLIEYVRRQGEVSMCLEVLKLLGVDEA